MVHSAATAPASVVAFAIAQTIHARASSIRSCFLPWRRFPFPLTSFSAF